MYVISFDLTGGALCVCVCVELSHENLISNIENMITNDRLIPSYTL